jgi:hypothetical protein
MGKMQTKSAVWQVLIALTVLGIWGQSLLGQELSAAQSESVQGLLGRLFGEWIYDTFWYQYIRKVAHFAEYALLGIEWMGYRLSMREKKRPSWWLLCAFGPMVAVCDELLQFVSARAPRATDVLLDVAGYACGAAVIFGLAWLCRHLRKV